MFPQRVVAFVVLLLSTAVFAESDQVERRSNEADRLFDWDECLIGHNKYGPCDVKKFPKCGEHEFICYNRRPRQDKFHADTRQPVFFIDYRNVFCYPDTWGGCSSCTPGRLCISDGRCILEENAYDCEQWI